LNGGRVVFGTFVRARSIDLNHCSRSPVDLFWRQARIHLGERARRQSMGLPIGSTGPQTRNESKQDLNTAGNVRVNNPHVNYYMQCFSHPFVQNVQYRVCHKWKANARILAFTVHHSAIQIDDMGNNCICTLEVVNSSTHPGDAMVILTKNPKSAADGYVPSKSYKPNPVVVTGADIANAYTASRDQMALDYDIFANNCQKYARLFMTELGAKHYRRLFHF
jgi:hypothetical protein